MIRNQKFQLAVGLLLTAGFLWYAFRGTNPHDLWAAIRTFNWLWSIPFLALTFASLYIRAWRWRFLMTPLGDYSAGRLYGPMMAGFGINSLLPGRVGEFARAYILGKREKLPFAKVFATIVVERIFDMITLLVLLAVVFANLKIDPSVANTYQGHTISGEDLRKLSFKLAMLCGLFVVGALGMVWPLSRDFMLKLAVIIPYAPRRFREKIAAMAGHFAEGFESLTNVKTIVAVFGLSLGVWFLVAWSMQVLGYGIPGMRSMTLNEANAILVISCIAIIIPAAPGYWGLMEVGIIFGLTILNVESDKSRALAYALLVHSLQYFPIVAVGLYYVWKEKVSLSEIQSHAAVSTEDIAEAQA